MEVPIIPRTPKAPQEVTAIEEVQRAVEEAFDAVVAYLKENDQATSEDAHHIIDTVLARAGCTSPEGHIVAGGLASTAPHEKGSGVLKRGEQIVIDMYPKSNTSGYFADMSRTVCIGTPPSDIQKMYDTVLAAQELAFTMIRPGALCRDIQIAVEGFFIGAGYMTSGEGDEFKYAEGFVHSIGHGVGLEIHESPHFGRKSEDVLMEGDVITVEPGLYYKSLGGIRIEDMVLVTADGYRNLTNCSKTFVIANT